MFGKAKRAGARLFIDHKLDSLVTSSPITEQQPENIPAFALPHQYTVNPVLHTVISPLEPAYIDRPITAQGQLLEPHPLQGLVQLAESSSAGHQHLAGILTATYPTEFRKDLGREVCVRFPNGDGWFNVVSEKVAFGATVDGCGGDGDDEAWLAGHLTMAIALQVIRDGLPGVDTARSAALLLQRALVEAHRQIMQLDLRGSTAVLLHACFHVTDDRYVFVFANTGDTEVMWWDSTRGEWRYLVEPIGHVAHTLRVNSAQLPGAIGKDAADKHGELRKDTNLQYGLLACRAADTFLLASDGLWDTLDAVQNGIPRQFDLPYDDWSQLPAPATRRVIRLVPIFKQRRLNDVVPPAIIKQGALAVVEAAVEHAWQSTQGERELFQIIDVESQGSSSIYQDTLVAKGQDSLYVEAKRASEAAGQMIFAKPDHLGIQAFSPAAIPGIKPR